MAAHMYSPTPTHSSSSGRGDIDTNDDTHYQQPQLSSSYAASTWTVGHDAYMQRLATIRAASLPRFIMPAIIDSLSSTQLHALPDALLRRALIALVPSMDDIDMTTIHSVITSAASHTQSTVPTAATPITAINVINRLPQDLLSSVFSFLDGSDEVLGCCYLVCRTWLQVVQLPSSCTTFDDMRYGCRLLLDLHLHW
jgi:hypothetical protein